MAVRAPIMGALGRNHTAGIFADPSVDGPEIGTLVVIMDRAKNLPNRRTMGKQDPYVAARLGKEAKKTETDKRGGQTPKWDQELRFTVHDSVDYHQLKVSVFNDDKKTELIGETFVSLEAILNPGGGQSDAWHTLNCKGKYAGEIRIELTYYDTRPKPEKPVEKKRESMRPGDGQSPSLSGPRESIPVKRRPLPSDPSGASPSPISTPTSQPPAGSASGPRGYRQPQSRATEQTPTHRPRHPEQPRAERRRPVPEAQHDQTTPPSHQLPPNDYAPYHVQSNGAQYDDDGFDMSYTAPKPYEVRPIDPLPQPREPAYRTTSQRDFRTQPPPPVDLPHSISAPIVPGHQYEHDLVRYGSSEQNGSLHHSPEPYEEPHQVAPLRLRQKHSRSDGWEDQYSHSRGYIEAPNYGYSHPRPRSSSSMQPTVEDEDDVPPPPPVHRRNAATISQPVDQHQHQLGYDDDAPPPLNIARYRAEPPQAEYDRSWSHNDEDYGNEDHRYIQPPPNPPQPSSRPVSRDTMAPSPLRNEIPPSLIAGYNPSVQDRIDHRPEDQMSLVPAGRRSSYLYQASPVYETAEHQSYEDNYGPQYDMPLQPYSPQQVIQTAEDPNYYPHSSPQEPQHMSSVHDPAPLIKPRAVSPVETRAFETRALVDTRVSRLPARSTPTRKSVSPRPPPAEDPRERRLSAVAFSPDDFNVLNPKVSRHSLIEPDSDRGDLERRNSHVEVNEQGQVVTFSGRVVDASDHLPVDSWAPEPEQKGTIKERPQRDRISLNGARDLRDVEAARQRERERKERDRMRNAAAMNGTGSPSTALVTARHHASPYGSANGSPSTALTTRHHYSSSMGRASEPNILPDYDTPPGSGNRKLQKRDRRPVSTYSTPTHSPGHIPSPHDRSVLRERENLGGYGGSPGYGSVGSRHSVAAPPLPAKIPLDNEYGGGGDLSALSRELQSIDIGPTGGSAGRSRAATRRRYGGGGY